MARRKDMERDLTILDLREALKQWPDIYPLPISSDVTADNCNDVEAYCILHPREINRVVGIVEAHGKYGEMK